MRSFDYYILKRKFHVKIKSLRISNILSFKYYENILDATKIEFDKDLNIIIGQNGSGKSTALEVINFIFRKVIFTQFNINQDSYGKKETLTAGDRKNILTPTNRNQYNGFRLDPNWNSENASQQVQLEVELDEIDSQNIKSIVNNFTKLKTIISLYSNHTIPISLDFNRLFTIIITLDRIAKTFTAGITPSDADSGYLYLVNFHYYKYLIEFYNLENTSDILPQLNESFTIIGGYRNYNSFNPSISLQESTASKQIETIKIQEFQKSLNATESSEPPIFNIVRLRVAERHYSVFGTEMSADKCLSYANNLEFLTKINEKLQLINLKVQIELTSKQKWGYSFGIYDSKRNKQIFDINVLSAGQKAIVHLVFEAYGRGDIRGGLVIIDEPELHLHYQFQNEYIKVIEALNKDQKCQYILVTHSDSLINSKTIHNVKRFALDIDNYTVVKYPTITSDEVTLVKILDNTKSSYAFFAKKVILVEGESDRYFYKSLLDFLHPNSFSQEIAILDITGKGSLEKWKTFFTSFGLFVSFIGDLDAAFGILYGITSPYRIIEEPDRRRFCGEHPDLYSKIDGKYAENIYILKKGHLELYLPIHNKGIAEIIKFCHESLEGYIAANSDHYSELKLILDSIYR